MHAQSTATGGYSVCRRSFLLQLKFIFSEKTTKICEKFNKFICDYTSSIVKTNREILSNFNGLLRIYGDFVRFLWPSQNIFTLVVPVPVCR